MYQTFILRQTDEGTITGYHWPLEDPKKVICIVHGVGEYSDRYDRIASSFNEAGYAAVSMDLRGHGHSLGKRGHCAPRQQVQDDISALLTFAELTYPEKPIVLYGHSMGGNIVMDYRSRGGMNDVPAGYLVTSPWIRLVRPIPEIAYWGVQVLSKVMPRFTVGSAVKEEDLGNPEIVRPYNDDPMVHNRISAQSAVDGFRVGRMLDRGTIPDNGRARNIPLLLMHGGEDRICDVKGTRSVAARLMHEGDRVEMIEWPGLRHEIHNGGPNSNGDEVIRRMIDYFDSL